jgi:hypothetical protein
VHASSRAARSRRVRAAQREPIQYPDPILEHLLAKHASERRSDRWWLIGHIRVLGQSEELQVLNDPETDEGRLRLPKNSTEDDGRNRR